jgi:circadian clock protein KaiB
MLLRPRRSDAVSRRIKYRFRLYIAGNTANSAQAIANLTALCRTHLLDRHEIEIVDVFSDPQRALADGILMTPILIKVSPEPRRRIVGTLSHEQLVLQTLGMEALPP